MVIVAGHLIVDPDQREPCLADCVSVVEEARKAPGCLDFTIAADLVDPDRINVFERWESQADDGPDLPSLQPWPAFARPARSRLGPHA